MVWYYPISEIIITADEAASFRENSFKNMTEVDGVRSGGSVTFKTKAPSDFYGAARHICTIGPLMPRENSLRNLA